MVQYYATSVASNPVLYDRVPPMDIADTLIVDHGRNYEFQP